MTKLFATARFSALFLATALAIPFSISSGIAQQVQETT